MLHESYWIADDQAIDRMSPAAGLGDGELLQLRELLARLAAVTNRAELLEVIDASVRGGIGASTFAVLERCSARGVTTLLWGRGDEGLLGRISAHPRVRETLRYGTSHAQGYPGDEPSAAPAHGEPVASVPFWGMGGNVCGALVLAGFIPPKRELNYQDKRVLALLASEGGRLLCTMPPDDRAQGVA